MSRSPGGGYDLPAAPLAGAHEMRERRSPTARAVALVAVIGGFLAVGAVVVGSIDGDDGAPERGRATGGKAAGGAAARRRGAPAAYVVQNGDTLTSISRRTGVPVARIERLNPGVDPQILISGQKLKLR